ncbi:uncharacterized protein N7518_002714 [Penicillium psychrosexuale]|uniref:uncharacterized protein n=1 Tax=Penicillium psychrosexuale TaxID=1002107 RepID=UPI002545828B|nr:uncharacterized protein N7518_002714 [Penicillium psychrosexuale]KAJ5800646.1 hypothetical protein N7518_002714 [Penicillium psychrosexuale]
METCTVLTGRDNQLLHHRKSQKLHYGVLLHSTDAAIFVVARLADRRLKLPEEQSTQSTLSMTIHAKDEPGWTLHTYLLS